MAIVPVEWTNAMYEKTGVTGPYVMFWGAVATIFSKEYFVASTDTTSNFAFLLTVALTAKYAGPKIRSYLDSELIKGEKEQIEGDAAKSQAVVNEIDHLKTFDNLPEANTLVTQVKKVNMSASRYYR